MLEATGSLACFDKIVEDPVVFFGTGNCADVRFYFARPATAKEREEEIVIEGVKPKSLSREMRELVDKPLVDNERRSKSRSKSISEERHTTIPVQTTIVEMFSDTINTLDAFLKFAVILWRVKLYRYEVAVISAHLTHATDSEISAFGMVPK